MQRNKEELEKIFALFCEESNLMPQTNLVKALKTAGYSVEDDFGLKCSKIHLKFEEFVDFTAMAQTEGLNRENIEEAFRCFDPKDTGYIKASEFKSILTSGPDGLTDTDVNILFEMFPPNDQGMICYSLPISYVFDEISNK